MAQILDFLHKLKFRILSTDLLVRLPFLRFEKSINKFADLLNLPAELTAKNAIARVNWYSQNGYWYDLLPLARLD